MTRYIILFISILPFQAIAASKSGSYVVPEREVIEETRVMRQAYHIMIGGTKKDKKDLEGFVEEGLLEARWSSNRTILHLAVQMKKNWVLTLECLSSLRQEQDEYKRTPLQLASQLHTESTTPDEKELFRKLILHMKSQGYL